MLLYGSCHEGCVLFEQFLTPYTFLVSLQTDIHRGLNNIWKMLLTADTNAKIIKIEFSPSHFTRERDWTPFTVQNFWDKNPGLCSYLFCLMWVLSVVWFMSNYTKTLTLCSRCSLAVWKAQCFSSGLSKKFCVCCLTVLSVLHKHIMLK